METKKNQAADINKMRNGFFQIGLIIACAIALSAFEYTQFSKENVDLGYAPKSIEDDVERIYEVPPKKPEPQQQERPRVNNTSSAANTSAATATTITTTTNTVDPNQSLFGLGTDSMIITGGNSNEPYIDPNEEFVSVESMPYCAECAHYTTNEERTQCTYMVIKNRLSSEAKYPRNAKDAGIEGTVELSFRINKEGEIEDVQILRSVHSSLDKEALRTVTKLPKMFPGEQRGKKVNVRYRTKLKFELK